jgi:hypothetical protein
MTILLGVVVLVAAALLWMRVFPLDRPWNGHCHTCGTPVPSPHVECVDCQRDRQAAP